jgi:hypothetical protein
MPLVIVTMGEKRKEKKGSSMGFEPDVNRTCNLLNRKQIPLRHGTLFKLKSL